MSDIKKDTLVNRQRYASTFDIELLSKLKHISTTTGVPISKLFDRALELLIKEYENTDKK